MLIYSYIWLRRNLFYSYMQRTALFPGSFDPFTRGHAAVVEEALALFDRVVVAVGYNVEKRSLLSVDARRRLIEDIYADEPRVEVTVYTSLTGDEARRVGACAIVRSVRTTTDFEYERTMAQANLRLYPELRSVLLMLSPEVTDISSSLVRELMAFGRSVDCLMPEGVDISKYLTNEQ